MTHVRFWWQYPFLWVGLGPWLARVILAWRGSKAWEPNDTRAAVAHLECLCLMADDWDDAQKGIRYWFERPLVRKRYPWLEFQHALFVAETELWPRVQLDRASLDTAELSA